MRYQGRARDHLGLLGLQLVIDENEGWAFIPGRTDDTDEGSGGVPRLAAHSELSFQVSVLIALLRRRLAEADTQAATRVLFSPRTELIDLIRVFLPDQADEKRLFDRIDAHIGQVEKLVSYGGFPRRVWKRPLKCVASFERSSMPNGCTTSTNAWTSTEPRSAVTSAAAMSDTLFARPDDEDSGAALAGFRLERVEVLTRGTFNRKVWTLNLAGRNTLLTGDIGCSGKSTFVDAVARAPRPRASGRIQPSCGCRRDRDLRSYVLGHYKSESSDTSSSSKPVPLRDESTLSVILGVFRDRAARQDGDGRPGVLVSPRRNAAGTSLRRRRSRALDPRTLHRPRRRRDGDQACSAGRQAPT